MVPMHRGHRHEDWTREICVLLCAMVISLAPWPTGAEEWSPTGAVKGTIGEVFVILKEFQDPTRNGDRRAAIEEVLKRRINCAEMAKRSLGAFWMDLDESQRRTYVGLFVELLRDSLANRMSEYSGERIEYLSERREGEFAEVKIRLFGSKVDTAIDFRLTNRSGIWLIYDAVMDGASLVANYHAQFSRIIGETSVELLVDKMKEKTVVVKLFEKRP